MTAAPGRTGPLTADPAFAPSPLGPDGLKEARALHRRCSERTLASRYFGPPGQADGHLPHLLAPRHGHTLAARAREGALIGLGHLLWDEPEEAEVAFWYRTTGSAGVSARPCCADWPRWPPPAATSGCTR